MAKKPKPATYSVFFDGLNKMLTNVKLIVTNSDEQHFHIEQKGNQWLMLVSSLTLFERYGADFTVKLQRKDPNTKWFEFPDGHCVLIHQLVHLNVLAHHKYYHCDITPAGLRICVSTGFMEETKHCDLTGITIVKDAQ